MKTTFEMPQPFIELWEKEYFESLAPSPFDSFVSTEETIDKHWEEWLNACLLHWLIKEGVFKDENHD